ncbi:sigma-70 family RNA polymerase sigma factor [Paenibacillus peoriae]|uniref:Sigma-70 family RNA polymerase sigma factor n=1 Tax=Paenibacillus peoriae TaxID=59893 RepID=A0A7H0Y259_9BACL|nr:sigma-70 family RNA polymerase sigma factor [Paenibacillus peoriae]QNR65167.1 sigma-70 family RNA polymerase sigma factor [Paenibacillus peoriae]
MKKSYSENIHQWIMLTLQGNRNAFTQIYYETIDDASNLVYTLLIDKSQKEDILQEIYLETYKSLSKFDCNQSFRPWFIGIVIRQTKNFLRKRGLLFRLRDKIMKNQETTFVQDFSEKIVEKLDNVPLQRLIENLSFKLKTVIVLRYLYDYSLEEMSTILDIPLGTVKSRISYALSILRKKIKSKKDVEGDYYGT